MNFEDLHFGICWAAGGVYGSAMLVMGLDTALQRCSVAILRDGAVVGDQSAGMERGHAEHLAPMAAKALDEAGVKIADLDRIGVVIGPGGFTGVRIALAFARGLAIGTNIEIVGVTSLLALAANADDAGPGDLIAPVIDARRGQVYAALYDGNGQRLVEPFVTEPEKALEILAVEAKAAPVATIGSGAPLLPSPPAEWRQSAGFGEIDAKAVAALAAAAPAPAGPPSPLYLRPPDAKPPKPGVIPPACRK